MIEPERNSFGRKDISQLITLSMMGTIYHWGLNNSEQAWNRYPYR
ncbi:hypothetical protein [Peribacillus aracenensis]|nr:hypothetical protein [Peribacillus sp. BBB004]